MAGEVDLGIDGLEDVEMIGSGGFSTVYSARHSLVRRPVAIKVLHRLDAEADRRRFERECEVMGRLSDHPNVVTIHHAGYAANGHPYLVMELVPDGTLADLQDREGRLSWDRAADYMAQVCDALSLAHAEDILHRDIKPENILLDGDTPKVTDFGIAYLRDATGATSTHITASWLHTPPETFDNKRDERSDIYSLGSTLYCLIHGSAPYWRTDDESLNPLLMRLITEPAPTLDPTLAPPDLVALVGRTLARDPADRPQSAAELAEALRSVGSVDSGAAPTVAGPEMNPPTPTGPVEATIAAPQMPSPGPAPSPPAEATSAAPVGLPPPTAEATSAAPVGLPPPMAEATSVAPVGPLSSGSAAPIAADGVNALEYVAVGLTMAAIVALTGRVAFIVSPSLVIGFGGGAAALLLGGLVGFLLGVRGPARRWAIVTSALGLLGAAGYLAAWLAIDQIQIPGIVLIGVAGGFMAHHWWRLVRSGRAQPQASALASAVCLAAAFLGGFVFDPIVGATRDVTRTAPFHAVVFGYLAVAFVVTVVAASTAGPGHSTASDSREGERRLPFVRVVQVALLTMLLVPGLMVVELGRSTVYAAAILCLSVGLSLVWLVGRPIARRWQLLLGTVAPLVGAILVTRVDLGPSWLVANPGLILLGVSWASAVAIAVAPRPTSSSAGLSPSAAAVVIALAGIAAAGLGGYLADRWLGSIMFTLGMVALAAASAVLAGQRLTGDPDPSPQ